ncbi:hypothetical protein L195_g047871, partial [Trifolium pratense]
RMEMKNIVFVIVLLAAMINTIMGHPGHHHAPAPAPSKSDAASFGSFFVSSLLSFVVYYLNFHA